jgi:hypothetical protein
MRLNRLDFIKELEEKQAKYLADKADAKRKEEQRIEEYQQECKKYLIEVAKLLESGVGCSVETDRYHKQSLSIVFPKEVTIPEPPKLIEQEETYTYGYRQWDSSERDYNSRERLLLTLRVSADAEITLTKQILDML